PVPQPRSSTKSPAPNSGSIHLHTADLCALPTGVSDQIASYRAAISSKAVSRMAFMADLGFHFLASHVQSGSRCQCPCGIRYRGEFAFQKIVRVLVKAPGMPAPDPDVTICRLRPFAKMNQSGRYAIVVRSTFDRVRDRCEADIRLAFFGVRNSLLDIFYLLSVVTPHQEHTGLDPVRLAVVYGGTNLLDGDAALHCIQNPLRPAFRTDPDPEAAQLRQRLRHRFIHPVGAGDAFEGNRKLPAPHLGREFEEPAMVNGKNVIGQPKHFRVIALKYPLDFADHRFRRSAPMRLAIDRVAAPIAAVGAAARRNQRDRAFTVKRAPCLKVFMYVDAFAIRPRLSVEIFDQRSGGRANGIA